MLENENALQEQGARPRTLLANYTMGSIFLGYFGDHFTFHTFGDKVRDPSLTRTFNGTFKQHFPELQRLNAAGAGIFFAVNETDGKGRKSENILRVRAVCADFDEPDENRSFNYDLPPSIVIESSPGRHHVYWLLEDNLPLSEFKLIQQALAKLLGSDPAVSDLPRLLRVPGFYHQKSDPFLVKEIGGKW